MSKKYYVASISGGKDSTAMLLIIKKKQLPLDEIVFCDTGVEFDEIYRTIKDIDEWAKINFGFGVTILKPKHDFIYYVTKYKRTRGKYIGQPYVFPTPKQRWCMTLLKLQPFKKYFKNRNIITYIGYNASEKRRFRNNRIDEKYPLVEYGITNDMVLSVCSKEGFNFYNIYEKFDRASCWCCPFQPERNLETLAKYYPDKFLYLMKLEQINKAKTRFGFSFKDKDILQRVFIKYFKERNLK